MAVTYRGVVSADQPSASQPAPDRDATRRDGLARVRRRPSIPAFLITGAVLGAIVGALFAQTTGNGGYSASAGTAYVAVLFAIVGLVLGAIAIIYLDHRADRH